MENKVTFDLNKIYYEKITGEKQPILEVDPTFSQRLSEYLYCMTANLSLKVLSMDLYKSPKIEVNRQQLESLKEEMPNLQLKNPIIFSFESYLNSCLAKIDAADAEGTPKEGKRKV